MTPDRHDIRTIRREALARRLFVALFVALGLIVAAAQLRAASPLPPTGHNPSEVPS